MDNTQGLGAAMEESWQRDQAKSQEKRIQILEEQVKLLGQAIWDMQRNFAVLRSGM